MVAPPAIPALHADLPTRIEAVLGVPATDGNRVDVLRNGVEIFPAMLDAIARAERLVELVTFVYWRGDIARRFARALVDRARDGLEVRVLLDACGAHPIDRALVRAMAEAGCDVQWLRPLAERRVWAFDPRSHRKLLVCDGRVAFTGGVGIAEQWQGDARDVGEWRDTHFRVEGPAVFGLRAAFLDNWIEAVGDFEPTPVCDRPPACPDGGRAQVVASSQRPGWSPAAMALASLLDSARQRLRIATPRFVPRARLLDRLVDAARRGVRVELLLPGERCDARLVRYAGRRVFDRLLAAGVAIWRFEPSMMHQRAVLVDGRAACVGSAGFDPRSTRQDDEVCLLLYDRAVVARLEADFDTDLERSTAVTDSRWRARPWSTRLVEWLTWRLRRRL